MPLFRRRRKPAAYTGMAKTANTTTQLALEKPNTPFYYYSQRGLPTDLPDEELHVQQRELARKYYAYHDLIPLIIDIYARFPLRGMRIVCQTDQQQEAFERQFWDILDYRKFLAEVGREYFKAGEVTCLGTFDHEAKQWVSDQVLNPDAVHVDNSPFLGGEQVTLDINEHMQAALEYGTWEEQAELRQAYPDLAEALDQQRPVRLAPEYTHRIVNNIDPWDTRGTPMMTRAFDSLLREEKLYAAQDAMADRLYSPLILATLGAKAQDLGPGMEAQVPTQADLQAFADDFNQAMAADFRTIVHNFGIDIRSVFGRESLPKLDSDFDRLEKKILRAFGIGASLIDGSSQGAYASTAINRDFVSNLMADYQDHVRGLFRARAEYFARQRGIYEVETDRDGNETIKTRRVLRRDPDTGELTASEEPVVYVPDLEFAAKPLGSAQDELNLLIQLRKEGVPVSQQALAAAAGDLVDIDTERLRISGETVDAARQDQATARDVAGALAELDATSIEQVEQAQELLDQVTPDIDQAGGDYVEPPSDTYRPSRDLR